MKHLEFFKICLKDLLLENDFTLKQLSKATGINISSLYDYKNQTHLPSLNNAIKIADTFGCSLDFLFGFVNDYRPCKYILIGDRKAILSKAFDDCKLSRYQISSKTNISEAQLSRWYKGKQNPTLISLITLAPKLDVSLDYLVGRTPV